MLVENKNSTNKFLGGMLMYYIKKTMEISAAHQLNLPYASPCNNLHGHNWIITIYVKSDKLVNGMVVDFKIIKDLINKRYDHKVLNDFLTNPTAENIAVDIMQCIQNIVQSSCVCYRVDVQESTNNIASYEIQIPITRQPYCQL